MSNHIIRSQQWNLHTFFSSSSVFVCFYIKKKLSQNSDWQASAGPNCSKLMRGMEEIKCPAVLWFEWDWDGKLWHCCGISSFSLTRISFPLSLLQKKCTEANEHHCSKLCICGGGESVLPVTRDQRLARQLGAQTHLLLATDIADDGVGGRAGRGTEDCHHPFRHDLAHWEETQTAREKGSQAVLTSKVKYFQKRTSTARC